MTLPATGIARLHRRASRRATTAAIAAVALIGLTACQPHDTTREPSPSETASDSAPVTGPLVGLTIVIDPGHNGGNIDHPEIINEEVNAGNHYKPCDTTGTETYDGYTEHEFNFDIATRLAEVLESDGATVILTRDSDDEVGPCITDRVDAANSIDADTAISIHADGGPDSGRGFHIMEPMTVEGYNDDIVETSSKLAAAIATAIDDTTDMPPSDYIGIDGINPRDDMGGLNLSTVPKVMVECGNMRNAEDAALMTNPEFRQDLAEALAIGINEYLAP